MGKFPHAFFILKINKSNRKIKIFFRNPKLICNHKIKFFKKYLLYFRINLAEFAF